MRALLLDGWRVFRSTSNLVVDDAEVLHIPDRGNEL